MQNFYKYPLGYQDEESAPKYPAERSQEWLEVVPAEAPLYPLPAHTPARSVRERDLVSPLDAQWEPPTTFHAKSQERRVLGLRVPFFWTLVVAMVIILAAGIGGGVGGAMSTRHGSNSDGSSVSSSSSITATTSGSPAPTSSSAGSGATPTDGDCPGIQDATYTPYAVDGQPIPLASGLAPQEFKQQCWTNYVAGAGTDIHDILRIFMPTLENCMMTCAEYNAAYRAGLEQNAGVGGGYCVAVSLEKKDAGFCYLKNGTATNDTMGTPDGYSSAILLTDTGM
ncbi:hypothetical protein F5Y15DRAFT_370481 [Xylariaceae sp. FL0016]|nr:hypothetical protein F5Y15DRAFT_370481 [Xylariaceae sp. FL0016]